MVLNHALIEHCTSNIVLYTISFLGMLFGLSWYIKKPEPNDSGFHCREEY
jgi:uncharacterized membrane protein YpjA